MKELVKLINELSKVKETLEEGKVSLDTKIKELTEKISTLKEKLLKEMSEQNKTLYQEDGLVAEIKSVKSKGYSKEEEIEIIKILKEKELLNCISIKESLAKNVLKEELKTNKDLSESLKDFGTNKETEYVQVLTEDSYIKQQKIIEEKMKGKDGE